MTSLLLRLSVICVSLLNPSLAESRHDIAVRRSDVTGVIFTENFLWTSACRSHSHCAVQCVGDHQCVSFTVAPDSSGSVPGGLVWRGHSASDLNTSTGIHLPGARLYVLAHRGHPSTISTSPPAAATTTTPTTTLEVTSVSAASTTSGTWLKTVCSSNSDCPSTVSNVECFQGLCLCSPGYYYSTNQQDCLDDCPQLNLQNDLVEYPGWYMASNNVYSVQPAQSLAWCQNTCFNSINCYFMEYQIGPQLCTGSNVGPRQDPSSWMQASDISISFYQKTCL